jgi:hypothetical protein
MVRQRREGRFFGPRINCERVRLLPASVVRRILNHPRRSQHLLIWQNPWDGAIEEEVQVTRVEPPRCFSGIEAIEVSRSAMSTTDLHVFRRPLPRNGGNDVFLECPGCRKLPNFVRLGGGRCDYAKRIPLAMAVPRVRRAAICLGGWCTSGLISWVLKKDVRSSAGRTSETVASLCVQLIEAQTRPYALMIS